MLHRINRTGHQLPPLAIASLGYGLDVYHVTLKIGLQFADLENLLKGNGILAPVIAVKRDDGIVCACLINKSAPRSQSGGGANGGSPGGWF